MTPSLRLVLVVVLVPQRTAGRHDEADIEREVEVGLGLFFWVLIVPSRLRRRQRPVPG